MNEEQEAAMKAAEQAEARVGGTATQETPAEQPPAAPAQEQPSEGGEQALAGKYQSPTALIEGLNHAREQAGLPRYNEAVSRAMLDDIPAAEAEYRKMTSLMRQQPGEGQPENAEPDPTSPDQLAIDPASVEPSDLNQFLESKGLSGDELAQQYQSEGKLTDEQYEKLGMPKAVVNEFMAGQAARAQAEVQGAQQAVNEALQVVGGEKGFQSLSQWAAASIPKEELGDPDNPQPGTINARIKDPKQVKSVMYELTARRQQATGASRSQPLIDGTANASTPTGGFDNLDDFLKASDQNVKNGGRDAALRKRIQNTDIAKLYKQS